MNNIYAKLLYIIFGVFSSSSGFAGDRIQSHQVDEIQGQLREFLHDPIYNYKHIEHLNYSHLDIGNGHQIMRSGKLGKTGLAFLDHFFQEKRIKKFRSVFYVHKAGFFDKEENFAYEEYIDSINRNDFRFYNLFQDPLIYVDGRNPLNVQERYSQIVCTQDYCSDWILQGEKIKEFEFDGGLDSLIEVVRLLLDKSKQPALIHCRAGKHRTGIIIMILRYLQGGKWLKTDAVPGEGIMRGADKQPFLIENLNLLEYEYFAHAYPKGRIENIEFIRQFISDDRYKEIRDDLKKSYLKK